MRIDVHVHSKHSRDSSNWFLNKIECPESYSEPLHIYELAKRRGMDRVTLTDHNVIDGALEIAHLPDAFLSEEVSTFFPGEHQEFHVLVYTLNESRHRDIQKIRANILDLTGYLQQEGLPHALAHPFYGLGGAVSVEQFERFLLLFKVFELNGARAEETNRILQEVLARLNRQKIEELADKYGIEPFGPEPWKKSLIGGSDDHCLLNIARRYTEAGTARRVADFFEEVEAGRAAVRGNASIPETLGHSIYSAAYQYYKSRMGLSGRSRNPFWRFLDRSLHIQPAGRRLSFRFPELRLWRRRMRLRNLVFQTLQDLLRHETQKILFEDPHLREIIRSGIPDSGSFENKWFDFVNRVSNKVLFHAGSTLVDQAAKGNLIRTLQSLGAAGGFYLFMAPYLVAFANFTAERRDIQTICRFLGEKAEPLAGNGRIKTALFTDTFYEINGTALILRRQAEQAAQTDGGLTILTCADREGEGRPGLRNFTPVGRLRLPEFTEQTLCFPPFLEMLQYCYHEKFTHIHASTPGPVGLAALAVARILKLPFWGTYHSSFPQYMRYLTRDPTWENLTWKFILWYYGQMERVFVPSGATARELVQKGLAEEKIRIFPHGVDLDRFHPGKRNGFLEERYSLSPGVRLLYVGRISKEKNLEVLGDAFARLQRAVPRLQLVLVGDGPFRPDLEERLQGSPCLFTGFLEGEDLAAIFASCDLFVMPSTTDTFGNAVLEAQASGVPVIVTDMGGPQENVIPGETGLVVKGNDPFSLQEAIYRLVLDGSRRQAMGRAARRFAESHLRPAPVPFLCGNS